MINPFIIKKYMALIFPSLVTVIMFYVGVIYYGLFGGIGFMFLGLLLGVLVGNLFLKNPFSEMLEGKGILMLNMDSTGIIRPFIVAVASPFIHGKIDGRSVTDVFDRATVQNLAKPIKAGTAEMTNNGIKLDITEEDYNKSRFALFQYPCLIYNNQIKSLITKDFLSDKETGAFAEHGLLYLNRRTEELTSAVRDFARHVVENLKPRSSFLASKWAIIIIVVFLIILIILFSPSIIQTINGFMAATGKASGTAGGAVATVVPRG